MFEAIVLAMAGYINFELGRRGDSYRLYLLGGIVSVLAGWVIL